MKEPVTKDHILYDPIDMNYNLPPEWAPLWRWELDGWLPMSGGFGGDRE